MKNLLKNKNFILFIVLILALVITYVFEEKRNRDKELDLQKKLSIINTDDMGDLISFKGIKIDVYKKDEKYYSSDNNLILSNRRLDEFLQILSGLRIKKILSAEETKNVDRNFYIPNSDLSLTFKFKNGNLKFTLGKKLDFDQKFYMEVEKGNQKNMMIVADESPDPNVYQNDEEYRKSDFKYQRLQMLFYLTNVFFYETKVFNEFAYADNRINFKLIDIATFRNKKFSLNFEKSITIPAIPNGLEYFDENWVAFHRTLTGLEAKTIYYPFDSAKLNEALSILNVEDRDGKKYSLELYKKYGSLPGYFLKTSFDKILYELRPDEAKYFFVNIQDFWQKRLYPNTPEYAMTLQFPKESGLIYKLSIKDKEVFNAELEGGKVKLSELKKFIDFMKMNSDHVSEMTESPSSLVGKMIMKLYFANRNIGVILVENDVLVVDLDNKLKFHHYTGESIPFSIKMKDYFGN